MQINKEPYIMGNQSTWQPLSDEENLTNAKSLLEPDDPKLERKTFFLDNYALVRQMERDHKNYIVQEEFYQHSNEIAQITIYHKHERIVYVYIPKKVVREEEQAKKPRLRIKPSLAKSANESTRITDFFDQSSSSNS